MNKTLLILTLLLPTCLAADPVPLQNPFSRPAMTQNRVSSVTDNTQVSSARLLPEVRATLVGGDTPLALVGDAVIAVGQKVAGFELLAVREGVAVFKNGDEISEVRVNNDTPNETLKENSDVE
ncbi:MAG: hypothetical protein KJO35_04500 [Gammaproteobacteria bacterium]|nr:hypothetical protein [Gammaproteobacteria bacterium]